MSTNYEQLSVENGRGIPKELQEFSLRKKLASNFNRLRFLQECLAEQVLPKSAPSTLRSDLHPFTESARAYLNESCAKLRNTLYELKEMRNGSRLTPQHEEKLNEFNETQRSRLRRKLEKLCLESKWNNAGNDTLITNLSSKVLSNNEKQALSLGLKFDSGKDRYTFAEHVNRNYKWNDSETEKGFVQGILTCFKALADNEKSYLPRRYTEALKNLAKNEQIVITQADKGGGIIIMDSVHYKEKIKALLDDLETYSKKTKGYVT